MPTKIFPQEPESFPLMIFGGAWRRMDFSYSGMSRNNLTGSFNFHSVLPAVSPAASVFPVHKRFTTLIKITPVTTKIAPRIAT